MKTYKVRLIYIAAAAALAMAVSCTTRPSLTISEEDNGREITVEQGTVFEVKLNAQLGTGYSWILSSKGDVIAEAGEPEQITSEKKETGGTDTQVFLFKAADKGKGDLSFEYRQPWNREARPLKEYSVTVNVR